MEKVLLINRAEDLKHWNKKYVRLYYGHEFCPCLFPNKSDLNKVIKFVKKNNLNLTVLTSYLDTRGMNSLKNILFYLDKKKMLNEIVVNDYGAFGYIKKYYPSVEIILGRMISRFARLYQGSYFYENNIRRVEFSKFGDIRTQPKKGGIKISFYYPYSSIATSRYCPVANIHKDKRENHGITNCSKECLKIDDLIVENIFFERKVILKGNSQFVKNNNYSNVLDKKIDRLIFQPKIPV